jgi:hypothetical protein
MSLASQINSPYAFTIVTATIGKSVFKGKSISRTNLRHQHHTPGRWSYGLSSKQSPLFRKQIARIDAKTLKVLELALQ